MKNKQAGFTLIEVVAVAALLGVLVTMIMPSLDGANTKVKNAKLRNDLAAVDQAIQLYKMEMVACLQIWKLCKRNTLPAIASLRMLKAKLLFILPAILPIL